MSPSEDQLRAALHHGEGEQLDVDGLLLHAAATRQARRVRIAAVAAAVVVVAGIGATGAVIVDRNHHDATALSGSLTTARNPMAAQQAGHSSLDSRATSDTAPASSTTPPLGQNCPTALPSVEGPTDANSPAARGPLFAKPVDSILVCAYFADQQPVARNGTPLTTLIHNPQASAVATSLEQASTSRHVSEPCAAVLMLSARTLLFVATATDGTRLPVVVAPIDRPYSCNPEVTNGSAERFDWVPAPELSGYLAELRTVSPIPATGGNSGSPVH